MNLSVWDYVRRRTQEAVLAGVQDAFECLERNDQAAAIHVAASSLRRRLHDLAPCGKSDIPPALPGPTPASAPSPGPQPSSNGKPPAPTNTGATGGQGNGHGNGNSNASNSNGGHAHHGNGNGNSKAHGNAPPEKPPRRGPGRPRKEVHG